MRAVIPAIAPYATDGATVTGTGDVWADDSDATHIAVLQSSPPIANNGSGDLEGMVAGGHPYPPLTARVWLRWKSDGVVGDARIAAAVGTVHVAGAQSADPEAGWMRAPLAEADAEAFISLWRDGGGYFIQLSSRFDTGGTVTIYEANVLIDGLSVAPPCRLFPRADDLGVGSGRIYPPPKSQQRSGRRFGYY